uniref:Beta-tubulin cofactor d n=1 Tax=Solanum tuberosum TaxID=4113 RepID=M1CG66_SOLTU
MKMQHTLHLLDQLGFSSLSDAFKNQNLVLSQSWLPLLRIPPHPHPFLAVLF